jgi:hypothetical protein
MKKNTNPNQRIDAPITSQAASTLRDRKKIEFRKQHSLISPAQRIIELRNKGYDIETQKIRAQSIDGRWHNNIALYTLISEPSANDQKIEVAA